MAPWDAISMRYFAFPFKSFWVLTNLTQPRTQKQRRARRKKFFQSDRKVRNESASIWRQVNMLFLFALTGSISPSNQFCLFAFDGAIMLSNLNSGRSPLGFRTGRSKYTSLKDSTACRILVAPIGPIVSSPVLCLPHRSASFRNGHFRLHGSGVEQPPPNSNRRASFITSLHATKHSLPAK